MARIHPLIDRLLPDYRRRHLFTTKLRLVAFVGFWAIYLYFYHGVIDQTLGVAAIVLGSFLLTGFAYSNVMRGRWLVPSFFMELVGDMVAIAVVLYLTGGPHSPYYLIYIFYIAIAGMLYNHRLAVMLALLSAISYGAFLLLCHAGIIPPLILEYGDRLPIVAYTPVAHFFFALLFLTGAVYTVRVASHFSQQRERTLEKRNRELTALNRMSATIRSAAVLGDVIEQLLGAVIEGLGFEAAALIQLDAERGVARLFVSQEHPRRAAVEEIIGRSVDGIEVPIAMLAEPLRMEIDRHRIIFRRELAELMRGGDGEGVAQMCRRIQEVVGFRRIVVMPVVAGETALGAIIGFSREPFVEEEQIRTMEAFANQSAVSLEAATLIERLRQLNEALAQANRVKSEFLATMSHELRTPLTAIIGFTELIIEGVMGEATEEQREALQEVLHNAADLLDLINSLLDLTKIESGTMGVSFEWFDLRGLTQRIVSTVASLLHKKRQQITVSIPDELPPIQGDERKVQQVLLNLVANANKFTPEEGHIDIRVEVMPTRAAIEAREGVFMRLAHRIDRFSKGGVLISIADDGIGIPADHHERIFEMFHQADSSTTRDFGGTGLGLALARQFVEMHGGAIWVESDTGAGAQFTFAIPLEATPD